MLLPWIALLHGCAWISDAEHAARVDADEDGVQLFGYGDGLDCDDNDPSVTGTTDFYRDGDADGYGDAADTIAACEAPAGYVAQGGDCDDTNINVSPDAVELCSDGVDNNCDALSCLPAGTYDADGFPTISATVSSGFGSQIDATGDFNGDNAADLLVLANQDPSLHVFAGPIEPGSFESAAIASIRFDHPSNADTLRAAWGDLNADGFSDVLLGCPGCTTDDGFEQGGELYAWFGPLNGESTREDADVVIYGFEDNGQLGEAFGVIGDATGDGLPDLLVGARGDGAALQQYGAWYFIPGGVSQSTGTSALSSTRGNTSWTLGPGRILSADFTGDGTDWAVVPGLDRDGAGGLYLLEDPALERSRMEDDCVQVVGSSGEASQRFAESFAVGDLDGDGRADLVVGAPGTNDVGVVFVFYAPEGEPFSYIGEQDAASTIVGEDDGGELGAALSIGPDLGGDGAPDLAIGAPNARGGHQGSVYVLPEPERGFVEISEATWTIEGDEAGMRFGSVLSGGFDLDDLGAADLAVGMPFGDPAAVLILGGGSL